jgi:hypothetical protein
MRRLRLPQEVGLEGNHPGNHQKQAGVILQHKRSARKNQMVMPAKKIEKFVP